MLGQRRADAEGEGIARGEHADALALLLQHGIDGGRKGREPGLAGAGDGGPGQLQMAGAAEDDLGLLDRALGGVREASQPIFSDPDYGQPGRHVFTPRGL